MTTGSSRSAVTTTRSGRGRRLVRGLVYPVPDPAFPFLGVHFTRGIDGTLHAGPNAVPALAREGYGRLSVSGRDLLDSLRFPGLRLLARRYAGTGALEIWRDLVKPAYLAEMRRYIPGITSRDVMFGPSGIRAQCLSRSGARVAKLRELELKHQRAQASGEIPSNDHIMKHLVAMKKPTIGHVAGLAPA